MRSTLIALSMGAVALGACAPAYSTATPDVAGGERGAANRIANVGTAGGRQCTESRVPARLPEAADLVDPQQVRASLSSIDQPGTTVLSLLFDGHGTPIRNEVVVAGAGYTTSLAVQQAVTNAMLQQQPGTRSWGVRLLVTTGRNGSLAVGRQEVCPAQALAAEVETAEVSGIGDEMPRISVFPVATGRYSRPGYRAVRAEILVDANGRVRSYTFTQGGIASTIRYGREGPLQWIMDLSFDPTLIDGIPVQSWVDAWLYVPEGQAIALSRGYTSALAYGYGAFGYPFGVDYYGYSGYGYPGYGYRYGYGWDGYGYGWGSWPWGYGWGRPRPTHPEPVDTAGRGPLPQPGSDTTMVGFPVDPRPPIVAGPGGSQRGGTEKITGEAPPLRSGGSPLADDGRRPGDHRDAGMDRPSDSPPLAPVPPSERSTGKESDGVDRPTPLPYPVRPAAPVRSEPRAAPGSHRTPETRAADGPSTPSHASPPNRPAAPPHVEPVTRQAPTRSETQSHPAPRPQNHPAPRPQSHPAPRPQSHPAPRPQSHPASRPQSHPAPRPQSHPAPRPQPRSQPSPPPHTTPRDGCCSLPG